MKREIVVGLLGLGTVGSGVVEIIHYHQRELEHQVGCSVKISKVLVQNKDKKRDVSLDDIYLTEQAEEILEDPEIDVIVEVMGGTHETRDYLLSAFQNKKHVVTANKDLMALYGRELINAATENGCDLFFEASVAGGIPVIRGIRDGLASDRLTKIMGIVNGTTNYILTKMDQEGRDYEEVLKEAQELGFAESDPTADVEGLDAARKMVILASLGFSMNVNLEDVVVRGITTVTTEDMEYCRQLGYTLKLIGLAKRKDGRIEVTVQPMLLPNNHPLASIHDEFNAVYVYGEAVGETMFYGPGAGSLPTATAIVSDLVTVMKNIRLDVTGQFPPTALHEKVLKSDEEVEAKYFLRLHVKDETGAFDEITSLFSKEEVSFEKLLQWPLQTEQPAAELVIVTHMTTRAAYERIYQQLEKMDVVIDIKSSYRVEGGQS